MAPENSEDDISYLKLLIEDHRTAFHDYYSQSSVIPALLHTPDKADSKVSCTIKK